MHRDYSHDPMAPGAMPVAALDALPILTIVPPSMAERIEAFDWSATPLGPRHAWPNELTIIVRQILDSSFPKAVVWGYDLTTIYNDAFVPILGQKPDALGRAWPDIWSEAWDHIRGYTERAFAGENTYIENLPLTIERSGAPEEAWFTFCYSPLRRADGSVAGMLDTVVETTAMVRAQNDLALVNQELGHRLKNTLAMVQAIASQTLRDHSEGPALAAFNERLAALGHAHDVLLRRDWTGASLAEVIRASVEPHDAGSRVAIDGPDMRIGSRTAVALSLMLHELATNAIKYGALSVPEGSVRLGWRIDADTLHFHWHETGGPPSTPTERKGFGTRLIDRGLGGRSKVDRHFLPTGLTIDITAPANELVS